MPSPFVWDVTKPGGSDALRDGDDLLRADKTTLRDVLRTLVPFGTPSTGWRNVQIANVGWLTQNAYYTGSQWNRDDTSLPAVALRYNTDGSLEGLYADAGANPITWTSGSLTGLRDGAVTESKIDSGVGTTTGQASKLVRLDGSGRLRLGADASNALDAASLQQVQAYRVVRWGFGGSPTTAAGTMYQMLLGQLGSNASEPARQVLVGTAMTLIRLSLRLGTAPGAGITRTYTVRKNGAGTAATLAYSGASDFGVKTWTGSIALAAGDLLALEEVIAGGTAATTSLAGAIHFLETD